jgi:hypothetical protein
MSRAPAGLVPPRELLVACLERAGYRGGMRLALFIHSWATVEADRGHRINPEEFGDYWGHGTKRTAYNRLDEFRRAFPELGPKALPGDIIVWPDGVPTKAAIDADAIAWRLELAA